VNFRTKPNVALTNDLLNKGNNDYNNNDLSLKRNNHINQFSNNRRLLSSSSPIKKLTITDTEKKQWFDSHLFVLESSKSAFCVIETNACTMFKQVFKRMKGNNDYLNIDNTQTHLPNKDLEDISFNNMEKLISIMNADDFYLATFVRDPLERLVSAYIDKCEKKNVDNLCEYAKWSGTDTKSSITPSFLHWVDGVIQCPSWPEVDNHIAPQHLFCNLYQYADKYDIFRFENKTHRKIWMQKAGLWDQYGASGWPDDISIVNYDPKQGQDLTTNNIYIQYWNKNSVLLARAIDAYRNDYIVFGMQMPSWICDTSIEKTDILKRAIRTVPRTLRPACENLPWILIPP